MNKCLNKEEKRKDEITNSILSTKKIAHLVASPWLLLIILAIAILASLLTGAYPIPIGRSLQILIDWLWPFNGYIWDVWNWKEVSVMTVIRPPRILVATCAGIALGLSGAALQGIMRNPLVSPDLVGVSSGAALGGVIAMLFGWSSLSIVGLAFLGGILALVCTFGLASLMGVRSDGVGLILAGFFVGTFFLALVGLCMYINPTGNTPNILYWMLGTFRGADPDKLLVIGLPVLLGGGVLMSLRWRLNLLSLGDIDAASLGINVKRLRWIVIAIVAWMVASQVAVSGVVGWVGLIVPHLARMLVGPEHRRLLPTSALLGGLFVLGLDDFTRSIIHGEIPVSVLAAFIGTPIVSYIFWKTQTKGWSE